MEIPKKYSQELGCCITFPVNISSLSRFFNPNFMVRFPPKSNFSIVLETYCLPLQIVHHIEPLSQVSHVFLSRTGQSQFCDVWWQVGQNYKVVAIQVKFL